MKTLLLGVGFLLSLVQLGYADDVKTDCTMWTAFTNEHKTMYLVGYSDALGVLGFGLATSGKSPEEIQKVTYTMWPQGYNLAKLGDELDKLCPTPVFKKMRVNLVITGLAAKVQRPK